MRLLLGLYNDYFGLVGFFLFLFLLIFRCLTHGINGNFKRFIFPWERMKGTIVRRFDKNSIRETILNVTLHFID